MCPLHKKHIKFTTDLRNLYFKCPLASELPHVTIQEWLDHYGFMSNQVQSVLGKTYFWKIDALVINRSHSLNEPPASLAVRPEPNTHPEHAIPAPKPSSRKYPDGPASLKSGTFIDSR